MNRPQDLTPAPQPANRRPHRNQNLAAKIREALLSLGGEAHRRMVIEQVARALGHGADRIPPALQTAVIISFEKAWRDERRRAALGFHLPFGEGSHRWGVREAPATLH